MGPDSELHDLKESHLDSELSRFASNGMSLPYIGSVLFAYTLNSKGPWWNVPSESGPSEPPEPKRQKVDGSA